MANIIKPKRSNTAAAVPTTGQLASGELAVNMADKKVYINNGTAVVQVGAGNLSGLGDANISSPTNGQSLTYNSSTGKWVNSNGGSGDVVGPASSSDNALTRFDGATGKIIQNSVVTLDDSGSMQGVTLDSFANSIGADHIHYKIKATQAISVGDILKYVGWNAGENAIEVAKVSSASDVAIGISHNSLAIGGFGLAVVQGTVEGFDTSAFTAGTILYPNTSGGLTATKPASGTYQACAFVLRNQAVNGALLVSFISPDYVTASSNTGNTVVLRDASGNFSAGTITAGLSGNASTATALATGRTIAITGDLTYTSPSFNGSGNVTAAGTLATVNSNVGSFTNASVTVNAKGLVTAVSSGTAPVTSVSGTAPIVSSGGATPAISITQATTSTNGYLSSTDWNTFNNKTSNTGTVTSVAMTVPTGLSVSGTPITTSGTLAVTLTAGYSIPTTASQTNWDSAYTQRLQWDGGSTGLTASTGRTSLGGSTVGQNFFTLTNPTSVTFPRINADNTVSALDATTFRTAIGAGTSSTTGTVTSVTGGSYLTGGTITSSGTLAVDATSANTASKVVARDASGNFSAGTITAALSGNATTATTAASCSGNAATATTASGVSAGVVSGKTIYDNFTATESQTTFTTSVAYTSGKIEVFANGVKMVNAEDVTVTSGTQVVFASGLAVNTKVTLVYPI